MNDENRRILVEQQRRKAHRFLSQAHEMVELKHWDMAANRFYYACFHIVQGLFIAEGLSAHKHSGMVSLFSLHYVKTGRIALTNGSFLARMMELRHKADYNCSYDVSQNEVEQMIPLAENFVREVEMLIDK